MDVTETDVGPAMADFLCHEAINMLETCRPWTKSNPFQTFVRSDRILALWKNANFKRNRKNARTGAYLEKSVADNEFRLVVNQMVDMFHETLTRLRSGAIVGSQYRRMSQYNNAFRDTIALQTEVYLQELHAVMKKLLVAKMYDYAHRNAQEAPVEFCPVEDDVVLRNFDIDDDEDSIDLAAHLMVVYPQVEEALQPRHVSLLLKLEDVATNVILNTYTNSTRMLSTRAGNEYVIWKILQCIFPGIFHVAKFREAHRANQLPVGDKVNRLVDQHGITRTLTPGFPYPTAPALGQQGPAGKIAFQPQNHSATAPPDESSSAGPSSNAGSLISQPSLGSSALSNNATRVSSNQSSSAGSSPSTGFSISREITELSITAPRTQHHSTLVSHYESSSTNPSTSNVCLQPQPFMISDSPSSAVDLAEIATDFPSSSLPALSSTGPSAGSKQPIVFNTLSNPTTLPKTTPGFNNYTYTPSSYEGSSACPSPITGGSLGSQQLTGFNGFSNSASPSQELSFPVGSFTLDQYPTISNAIGPSYQDHSLLPGSSTFDQYGMTGTLVPDFQDYPVLETPFASSFAGPSVSQQFTGFNALSTTAPPFQENPLSVGPFTLDPYPTNSNAIVPNHQHQSFSAGSSALDQNGIVDTAITPDFQDHWFSAGSSGFEQHSMISTAIVPDFQEHSFSAGPFNLNQNGTASTTFTPERQEHMLSARSSALDQDGSTGTAIASDSEDHPIPDPPPEPSSAGPNSSLTSSSPFSARSKFSLAEYADPKKLKGPFTSPAFAVVGHLLGDQEPHHTQPYPYPPRPVEYYDFPKTPQEEKDVRAALRQGKPLKRQQHWVPRRRNG
ncbi:hypothetical protein N0V90_013377 [Kalmusia sp. IMI 367209]|nr:hypothetical protein N0V90_013377 [Kalmusia sp. IMI 367209]